MNIQYSYQKLQQENKEYKKMAISWITRMAKISAQRKQLQVENLSNRVQVRQFFQKKVFQKLF